MKSGISDSARAHHYLKAFLRSSRNSRFPQRKCTQGTALSSWGTACVRVSCRCPPLPPPPPRPQPLARVWPLGCGPRLPPPSPRPLSCRHTYTRLGHVQVGPLKRPDFSWAIVTWLRESTSHDLCDTPSMGTVGFENPCRDEGSQGPGATVTQHPAEVGDSKTCRRSARRLLSPWRTWSALCWFLGRKRHGRMKPRFHQNSRDPQ